MAHSGLRYLVLLAGVVALVYFAYSAATRRGDERTARIIGSTFVGLLDLQMLLGLLMVLLGLFYPALIGHLFMMVGAVVVAHAAMALAKKSADRAMATRLLGVVVALLLIIGGIMAIGRSILGSGAPSML